MKNVYSNKSQILSLLYKKFNFLPCNSKVKLEIVVRNLRAKDTFAT